MNRTAGNRNLTGQVILEDAAGILAAYYEGVEKACDTAYVYAAHLEERPLFAPYVHHTKFLLTEVRMHLFERRTVYLPYILELSGKTASGHDCQHCSGRCDMQHTMKILELVSSLKKIESTVSYIQSELDAIYEDEKLKGSLRWLSNEMEGLIDKLHNAFEYEDVIVIPGIKAAQKNINAHS